MSPGDPAGSTDLVLDGAIAHITFNRPAARNAMTWAMYEQLAAACAAIAANPAIRVAVLRGAGGKAFVAGTDIEQFQLFNSGEDGIAYEKRVDEFVGALEKLPVPSIAVVQGWAVGGGMALANACDLRLATPGSRFGVPIGRTLGNCLSAANLHRLCGKLGQAWVCRMLLAAEMPEAETLPSGYVEIVPPDVLEERIAILVGHIAGLAPLTLQATKEALRRLGNDAQAADADLIRQVYGSEDFREGVAAFVAKRTPRWSGS